MKRYSLVLALVLIAALLPAAMAQDLHKTYTIGSGGFIRIQNVSGDIKITGYAGTAIVVNATVDGPDRQLLVIEDLSTANGIELHVKYPEHSNTHATASFDVLVPTMIDYNFDRINSVSGHIEVAGVRGRLVLNSVSGGITATGITGTANANSVSGNVEVEIPRLEGTGDMKFSSVSGNVIVTAPGAMGADIEMSTLSGALETNFPIEVKAKGFGPGRSARGTVGPRADYNLHLSTISGKVSLRAK
jgi:DUF4097 and DUF4098 domain-containing protein YvlB